MNKLFFILLLSLLNINVYSQNDSTIIQYSYIEDQDLIMMNELNGIQMISVSCSDTLMKGKRFFITIEEYNLGKLSKTDSLVTCKIVKYPVVIGADTIFYKFNMCDRIVYNNVSREFKIRLGGKLQNDSLNLKINYPRLGLIKKLKGTENYLFKKLQPSVNGKIKIKLDTKTPIIAYTGPSKASSGYDSYCMLDNELAEVWYEKFKVKHFYIFYLEIK